MPTTFKIRKPIPFDFALAELEPISPVTRAMFGCTAVYRNEQIVLILREKSDYPQDNGVWLATTPEHHASLKKDFPSMRSISFLGKGVTAWQVLPVESPDFEEAVLRVCQMILVGDARIGTIPKQRRKTKSVVKD